MKALLVLGVVALVAWCAIGAGVRRDEVRAAQVERLAKMEEALR